jgi:hypothetical protein
MFGARRRILFPVPALKELDSSEGGRDLAKVGAQREERLGHKWVCLGFRAEATAAPSVCSQVGEVGL